jgi:hypothetical protein
MDITNSTGQDTKYKVAGSGDGAGTGPHHHFAMEEAASWPTLPAGSQVHHDPIPPGPWVVCFVVDNHQVVEEVDSPSGQVTLLQAGANFLARIN